MKFEVKRMQPLFKDEADYKEFTDRHDQYKVRRGDLATYEGNVFLGIDAGSTTTKVALVGEDGSPLLYSFFFLQRQQRKPVFFGDRDLFP